VLEIGGSLPEALVCDHLQAEQWIAVEDFEYWDEIPEADGSRPAERPTASLKDATPETTPAYAVLDGKIEQVPVAMEGHFTRAYSMACFEHIHRLPTALDAIYRALAPGGKLFAMFSPLWSAYNGHHLQTTRDAQGRDWTFTENPLPPWGHLLLTPPEMQAFMEKQRGIDQATAAEIVYQICHNPHINRFHLEDYLQYFHQSPFQLTTALGTHPQAPDAKLTQILRQRYPSYEDFTHNGLVVVLEKPV